MKRIYIVRHAKSSWEDISLRDADRPLNARGERDAPFMGGVLRRMGVKPDILLSSPAVRAFQTAKKIAVCIDYPTENIITNEEFYEGYVDELVWYIKRFNQNWSSVMLCGHNPELTSLVNKFVENYIPNVPTCGVVCIDFDCDKWQEINKSNARMVFFEYPKKHLVQA